MDLTSARGGFIIAAVERMHLPAKACAYFGRATRLLCPVCGRTPIFPKARTIRRAIDWFLPFDGCPRCGYAFEREPGYFAMAVWGVHSVLASAAGLLLLVVGTWALERPPWWFPALAGGLVLVWNILLIRHAKAYHIALDHLLHPHDRGGGNDGGNRPNVPPPHASAPKQPCETPRRVR